MLECNELISTRKETDEIYAELRKKIWMLSTSFTKCFLFC